MPFKKIFGPSKTDVYWILGFVLLFLFLGTSVLGFYLVPSISMEPAILPGERILVNKLSYGLRLPFFSHPVLFWNRPQRGDIVVFENTQGRKFIKRVIGLPGDLIVFENGKIFVNKEELQLKTTDKKNVTGGHLPVTEYNEENSDLNLPMHHVYLSDNYKTTYFENSRHFMDDDCVFVLGDNRDFSEDSRTFGCVPTDNIIGKPFYLVFSTTGNGHLLPEFRKERVGIKMAGALGFEPRNDGIKIR